MSLPQQQRFRRAVSDGALLGLLGPTSTSTLPAAACPCLQYVNVNQNSTSATPWQHHKMAGLPPEILRILSACVARDGSPSNRTLQLMAFCGVCRRWREFGSETREPILLDGAADTQHGPKSTLPRFRKAAIVHKRHTFHGASRLLTGYSELTLTGEAIDDQMLLNIAVANGPCLTSVKLQGATHVTDAGLCTLISAAPNIKHFAIEDAGPGVVGHFVPTLLQHCRQLESLLVEGAASMDWAALRVSGAWAAAMAAAAAAPAAAAAHAEEPAAAAGRSSSAVRQAAGFSPSAARVQQRPSSAPIAARTPPARLHQQHAQDSLSPQDSATLDPQQQGRSSSSSTAVQPHAGSSAHSAAAAGPSSSSRQGLMPVPRFSSSSSCSGASAFSKCQEEGAASDDSSAGGGGGGSSGSSIAAGSDSTSISMPAQAVEALAQQLQHILSGGDEPAADAAAAAAASAAGSSSRALHHQRGADADADANPREQQRQRRRGSSGGKPRHAALRRLRVRMANVDTLRQLLECVPGLTELQLDGPALSVQAAAVLCPGLRRLSYLVSSPGELDASLLCLGSMRSLRALELEVKGMVLSTEQLRVIGLLPLRELSLDSHAYRQHPSMPRPQYSHLDNDGVKGLVDSICSRMRSELMPLKLSLCGATALKQEAVSALLRLPILASIDTGGCVKLTPMDRMRLVAKVKAGQGLMDRSAAAGGAGGGSAGGLRLPHVLL